MDIVDVKEFAQEQLQRAKAFAREIQFKEAAFVKQFVLNRSAEVRASLADDPEFDRLPVGAGIAAWTAIAAIDLRESTALADILGPRDTYLLTHTLLPTLAHVCKNMDGCVMNFRGDGLFASFGLHKLKNSGIGAVPTHPQMEQSKRDAVACGLALIEATTDAVQVVLQDDDIDANLAVGVGVDCGEVVVTRVGWMTANELTAYGRPVNRACKLSTGKNELYVSDNIVSDYPTGPKGTIRFSRQTDGYSVTANTEFLRR